LLSITPIATPSKQVQVIMPAAETATAHQGLAAVADGDAEFFLRSPLSAIRLSPEPRKPERVRKHLICRRARVNTATRFTPMSPHETPEEHFPLQSVIPRALEPRFVNRYDSHEILLAVDGSCINNGSTTKIAVAGCSFTYKDARKPGIYSTFSQSLSGQDECGAVGFALEQTSPDGEPRVANSNRAKLRAVIAALEFREWQKEGWKRIVIATDLEYIVLGATKWLALWIRRKWKKVRKGQPVANRDLWEQLHGTIDKLARLGTEVSFWLVSTRDIVRQSSALMQETKELARDVAAELHDTSSQEPIGRMAVKEAPVAPVQPLHFAL